VTLAELRERLRYDTPFYAKHALRIINESETLVPLEARGAQLRFDAVLERQRRAGKPQRAIVLKARKLGFSTWVQAKMMQRATQTANHHAVVVAHDLDTAGELFEIARVMYGNLPEDEHLPLRPPVRYSQKSKLLSFGTGAREFRQTGDLGLNSYILVDTATTVESGRGFTYNSLHLSEVALWPDAKRKLLSLQNAVPDDPGTMIVLESTANGHNHFKNLWDQAEAGRVDYEPIFFAWFEHPLYTRPFANEQERRRFEDDIGEGEYGAGEFDLLERHGCTIEQLNWRRWAIANRTQDDLQLFQQEYPATPEEAFLSSGDRVFSTVILSKLLEETKLTDPKHPSPEHPGPERGAIEPGDTIMRRGQHGMVEAPLNPTWKPGRGHWKVWKWPDPEGQYVIGVDVSGGERSDESADPAWHAIEVIDHRSREQVAEYVSRVDEDLLARQVYMAGLLYNQAWVAVEITGGFGAPVARTIWQDFGYSLTYTRTQHDRRFERSRDRLGWDTTVATKPIMIANAKELLRTDDPGIRSRGLVGEMLTFVRLNEHGKTGPTPGSQSDRVMAWMIAQQVANEKVLRKGKLASESGGSRTRSYYVP
jgi:hypothetical protein